MSTAAASAPTIHGVIQDSKPDMVVLQIPGTDYRLHLVPASAAAAATLTVGARVDVKLTARAKRVDVIRTGGRFVEPIIGRPRRLQGRVTATDPQHNTITVFCGAPFTCELTMGQNASEFPVGTLVAFDVERGAKAEPV